MRCQWLAAGLLLAAPLRAPSQQPACGSHCGTERWAVKTLTDSGSAAVIGSTPQQSSVATLIALPAPAILPERSRVAPTETRQFTVEALLIAWKEEAGPTGDHDFHLVLADPKDHRKTMIAEIPSPACASACASVKVSAFGVARQALIDSLGPAPITKSVVLLNPARRVVITGAGFLDFDHKQDGLAPNCIELHPVLQIQVAGEEPGGSIAPPSGVTHRCGRPPWRRSRRSRARGAFGAP
jgi:hypothetical protein